MHRSASRTPPMGWNSWDSFGTTVTEDEVLANAQVMAEQMLPAGWDTVVVDIQWYEPTARAGGYNDHAPLLLDGDGVQMPVEARFPSAAGGRGFGPLAARVHDLGLRFGVHLMRGIPRRAIDAALPIPGTDATTADIALPAGHPAARCPWNSDNLGLDFSDPASQAWLDLQIERIVGWGVDFLKVDDMLFPYHHDAIEALAAAISRAEERHGRDVTLSLSPGTHLSLAHLDHLRRHADMWRISDDLWDRWEDLDAQFTRLARWAPHQRAHGWADADMLPLGRIGVRAERGQPRHSMLTAAERRTMLTLWNLGRSPLFVGGDLPSSEDDTLADLVNTEVLAVGRDSHNTTELLREDDLIVWGATGTGPREGTRWAGVFNTADGARSVRVPLTSTGLTSAQSPGAGAVTELWTGRAIDIDPADPYAVLELDLDAHGTALLCTT
ncbi:glycoside hydrolase family 27 protein [Ruania halotolerans]|uniref:glycoside hydrolase family 27 protein n=1 Tax=Ruania halotolerans TaxID=2897773 RepID=UPI001E47C213|nr:glycoside hydrolase family 27 protein [Ruania halotolerans]UFU07798.1 glycoside hydrolase family 27 protein [Ruania halotolerans]